MQKNEEINPITNGELPENFNPQAENLPEEVQGVTEVEELPSDEDFHGLSKAELINKLEEALKNEDLISHRNKVENIKEAFRALTKEEIEQKKKEFEETKEEPDEEFEYHNPLNEKFDELYKEFNSKRNEQKKKREKYLNDNLKQKKEILEALKTLPENTSNISVGFEKLQSLQGLWRSIGPVPAGTADSLWKNYQFYVSKFFEGVKISKELRELDFKKNQELKNELIEKAEKLSQEPSIKRSLEQLPALQEKWREIGPVPKEATDELWNRFKAAADKIYDRKKEYLEQVGEKRRENQVAKMSLSEQLEKIAEVHYPTHKDWQDANDRVNHLMEAWKKIGFTPKEDKETAWSRFKAARQQFYENKEAFYNKNREEQNKNLEEKIKLCEQAEALKDSTDWRNTSNTLKNLQVKWKAIGPVSRKHSDKIWKRFRTACDHFFNAKAQQEAATEQELQKNIDAREQFIKNIESLELSEDPKENVNKLKELQAEWNALGEVPTSRKEQINKAYQKAVEAKMGSIAGKSGDSGHLFSRMKHEQMLQTEEGKRQLISLKSGLRERIKKLQAEVNQLENNIGFFGRSKNAQAMVVDFQQKIDRTKEEIKKLTDQMKAIPEVK